MPVQAVTADQVNTLTGKDPADYDLLFEVDIDPQATFSTGSVTGAGGGYAMQGCRKPDTGAINVWSVIPYDVEIEGMLVMDFNHEMIHLFGMTDNWPFTGGGLTGPSGQPIDDWTPYPLFSWPDADGDGVIEILDTTPYGTDGPQP